MIVKATHTNKDFKKRRGYEFEGYYWDGQESFLLWRKKFWRKKNVNLRKHTQRHQAKN